ncbi:nonribosomal peptide synthetase 30-like [Vespula maculifrons]|uniref:Nonribosomal peptide synthetase 30-like n=1 Tax=Vespula maculifrons TaxID=7453 RepID=A0ABD2CSR0_VESMC
MNVTMNICEFLFSTVSFSICFQAKFASIYVMKLSDAKIVFANESSISRILEVAKLENYDIKVILFDKVSNALFFSKILYLTVMDTLRITTYPALDQIEEIKLIQEFFSNADVIQIVSNIKIILCEPSVHVKEAINEVYGSKSHHKISGVRSDGCIPVILVIIDRLSRTSMANCSLRLSNTEVFKSFHSILRIFCNLIPMLSRYLKESFKNWFVKNMTDLKCLLENSDTDFIIQDNILKGKEVPLFTEYTNIGKLLLDRMKAKPDLIHVITEEIYIFAEMFDRTVKCAL